ncbi:MAG TPA: hypothetical protein VM389_08285 [Phycisphaerae bacterium]|nr:hypothetical protein [Phycisphaerae bacterium]HUU58967.1 hypothetical protein [Phycisphaerae bacterium]
MAEMSNGKERAAKAQTDLKQFIGIAGLLVLIIALLAVLWVRERKARIGAENEAARLSQRVKTLERFALMGLASPAESGPAGAAEGGEVRPVQRDDLPVEHVEFMGRKTPVLHISPAAGQRFGFLPGDVIVVGRPAASQPARDRP